MIDTADKYCGIMRIEKRQRPATGGIQRENNRTEEQHEKEGLELSGSDVDWERTSNNIWLVKDDNWSGTISDKIKEVESQTHKKTRKDAVVMLDTIYTASKEFFDDKFLYDGENPETAALTEEGLNYFKDCYQYHVNEFCQGDESRVINAVIHLDETTPHIHITSVPILTSEIGDRLNAKLIIGGRNELRHHQDKFYEDVSSRYGLDRGDVKDYTETKAHTTKREWQIAKQEEAIQKNNDLLTRQYDKYQKNKEMLHEQTEAMKEDAPIRIKGEMLKLEAENEKLGKENDSLKQENNKMKNLISKIRSIIKDDHSKISENIRKLFKSRDFTKNPDHSLDEDRTSR